MLFYVEIILQNKQHSSWDSKTCQREVFDERYDMELQHRRVKVKWRPPFWAAVVVKTCRLTSLCGVNDNRRYHSSQEEEGFWSSASFYSQKFRYRHNKKDLNHLKEDTYFFYRFLSFFSNIRTVVCVIMPFPSAIISASCNHVISHEFPIYNCLTIS